MQQDTRKATLLDLASIAPTDPDGFLRWGAERAREEGKFELSNGQVTNTMIWTYRAHTRVCANILGELVRILDRDRFDVGAADFAVRTPFGVRSPDIVIDEVTPRGDELSTSTPLFIAEVLSPSTAGTDFTAKLKEYKAIGSLRSYLICSQDEPRTWHWARQADGSWPDAPAEIVGRDGVVRLTDLGLELSMGAMFRGIPDAPTVE